MSTEPGAMEGVESLKDRVEIQDAQEEVRRRRRRRKSRTAGSFSRRKRALRRAC